MAGDRVNVTRWIFLELHSLSDHPYIYFEVPLSPPTPLNSHKARNSVPHFYIIDHKIFYQKLVKEIELWPSTDSLVSHTSIDLYVDRIASSITKCAKAARISSVKNATARNMPLVSKELCALRTKACVAYKAWTKVGDDEHCSRFRLARPLTKGS